MILLRRVIGDTLRSQRLSQHRTLREVSMGANVSLGYLSEIERGQKEASSELLASICDALDVPLSQVLREVSNSLALSEGHPAVLQTIGAQAGGASASMSERGAVPSSSTSSSPTSVNSPSGSVNGSAASALRESCLTSSGKGVGRQPRNKASAPLERGVAHLRAA